MREKFGIMEHNKNKFTQEESKLPKNSMSRLIAVQVLFQYEFFKEVKDVDDVINDVLEYYKNEYGEDFYKKNVSRTFLRKIVENTLTELSEINKDIEKFLDKSMDIFEMPGELLAILKLAFYELKHEEKIPQNVIISEYTDITNCFFLEKEVNFVNGILDAFAKSFREGIERTKEDKNSHKKYSKKTNPDVEISIKNKEESEKIKNKVAESLKKIKISIKKNNK